MSWKITVLENHTYYKTLGSQDGYIIIEKGTGVIDVAPHDRHYMNSNPVKDTCIIYDDKCSVPMNISYANKDLYAKYAESVPYIGISVPSMGKIGVLDEPVKALHVDAKGLVAMSVLDDIPNMYVIGNRSLLTRKSIQLRDGLHYVIIIKSDVSYRLKSSDKGFALCTPISSRRGYSRMRDMIAHIFQHTATAMMFKGYEDVKIVC